jgi:hypothetical protein
LDSLNVVENHEFCVVAIEQPFQELHADACESVAVGHHNFCDSAATDGVQKGEETRALPVDTTGNVLNEFMDRFGGTEIVTLALEIGVLMLGADTGVANAAAYVLLVVNTEDLGDISDVVETLACTTLTADNLNFALLCPSAKSA